MPDLSVKAVIKKYGGYIALGMVLIIFFCVLYMCAGEKKEYNVVCLGDSIVGNVRDESSIPGVLEQITGKSVLNGGFGGMSLACVNASGRGDLQRDGFSLVGIVESAVAGDFSVQLSSLNESFVMDYYEETIRNFEKVDWKKVEVVVIEYGVNDYTMGIPLDNAEDPFDRCTFGGALRYTLEVLKKEWPDKRIILCTPTYCWSPEQNSDCRENNGQGSLEDYVELEKRIANEFGVEVLDNYFESNIGNKDRLWSAYTVDGLHLNEAGRKHIAERIAECIGK